MHTCNIYDEVDKLTGDETYAESVDWLNTVWNLTEDAMPSAGAVLRTCADRTEEITANIITNIAAQQLTMNTPREIHGLLYWKPKGKATSHAEHVEVHRCRAAF